MKISSSTCAKLLSRAFLPLIAAVMLADTSAHAGLTIDIHLYHDSWGYYFYPWLNANTNTPNFPTGNYMIASPQIPTNGSQFQYLATNNTINFITGGAGYYGDFDSLLYGITNGLWSIWVTNGTTTQYQFQVTATGFTSNSFGACASITFPTNNQLNVPNAPAFTWTGPANWAGNLNVQDNFVDTNGNYNYVDSSSLTPSATSWTPSVSLPNGTNNFSVNYTSNLTATVIASTPTNNAGQAISGWVSSSTMETSPSLLFVAGLPPNPFDAYLVARYDFEITNYPGTDSSGNDNSANCGSGTGSPTNNDTFSTNAAVGYYAREYFGNNAICFYPNGAACFNNISNALYGSFSLSAWVNTTNSVNSDFANAYFGSPIWFDYNSNTNSVILSITGSKAAFTISNPNGTDTVLHSTTSVNDGHYHFIAVTRNQTNGLMSLYVDGYLEATGASTGGSVIANSTMYLAGGYSGFYIGLLDDVRIYSEELTASDVAALSGHSFGDFNTVLNTTNLTWTTSGDANWFVETTNTYNGAPAAAQSGSVINSQSSTLSVTVTGPGTLTFYWSSIAEDPNQGFDYEFYIDDPGSGDQADLYGDNPWQQLGPISIPSGQHTLGWVVYPNNDTDPTQAGFLDRVGFVQDTAPTITLNPFNQTNYPGYNVGLLAAATNAANSVITWQWFKVGSASPIPNATNALYIPTNSGTAGVVGSYYAVAGTPGGSATTTTASVSFVSAPLPPGWTRALKSPFSPVDGSVFNKDYYLGCAVDSAGDIYAAAQYFGSMNVVTNGNDANVLTAPGFYGAALVKHSANGSALWAVGLTNNQSGYSYGMTVAVAPGNGAYLASILSGTNWLGTNKFTDIAGGSVLLCRFDASGSNVWSRLIGGTNSIYTGYNTLVSDASGNVTLAGTMSGTVSFGGTNLSAPSGGGFIVQYDATGAVRWAQTVPVNTYNLAYGNGLLYVSLQSAVISGVTNASIGSLSNVTDRAWAVACLNATNGQPLWLRGVGHQYGANFSGELNDMPVIAVSGSNVFLTANTYGSSVVFGGLSVPLPGGRGQYFARYNTNGTPQAATVFGSPTTMLWASAANASGVYISGDFDSYSQFGNLVIAAPLFTTNDLDFSYNGFDYIYFTQPFVAKFDLNGNPLWARNGVSSAFANFRGIAAVSDGVWASGFLKIRDISSPAQFGTNSVYSDLYVPIVGGPSPIIFTQAGMIAKITESTAPAPVTLLSPQTIGTNFQFSFLSQTGFTNTVQYRTNLVLGSWQTYTTVSGDGTLKTSTIPLSFFSPSKQGFIRVSTQ